MKIAVFENEYDTVEMAFKYMNKKFYGNSLLFDNYPRSQSISDINELITYSLVIIDIDLSSQSTLDGFGLIKLIESTLNPIPKILILTGQVLSDNFHTENGLAKKYRVLEKPINYNKLKTEFDKMRIG